MRISCSSFISVVTLTSLWPRGQSSVTRVMRARNSRSKPRRRIEHALSTPALSYWKQRYFLLRQFSDAGTWTLHYTTRTLYSVMDALRRLDDCRTIVLIKSCKSLLVLLIHTFGLVCEQSHINMPLARFVSKAHQSLDKLSPLKYDLHFNVLQMIDV